MDKFRVTLTERDLGDLINGGPDMYRVVEKIHKAYLKGKRQKIMAHHREWEKNFAFYLKYLPEFNPTVPKLKDGS